MPMQQVEFEFPEPDENAEKEVELEDGFEKNLKVADAVGRETLGEKPKAVKEPEAEEAPAAAADDIEIEVVDDTPPEDRDRKPSEPPKDVTADELKDYSEKVQQRIKHFSKGYHDERRAKEQALREREALEQYAKQLIEENKTLKGSYNQSQTFLLSQAKKTVESQLAMAKKQYREAYESGDPDAIVEAQTALNDAQIRMDRLSSYKPKKSSADSSLQKPTPVVQQEQPAQAQNTQVLRDEKAEKWAEDNAWFGSDDEMTAFALGLHNKLVNEGVSPQSDTYYERINSRMRQVFPDQFDDGIDDTPETVEKKQSQVVAPVTRSTAPKKVRLSKSQLAIAKRLNVSPEEYARQVALLQRKQNG